MYHTAKVMKNAFRISKVRNESAIRLRVPGGHLKAKYLTVIQELAEKFGNGTVHLTIRQGYEIPGVKLAQMEEINRYMSTMISEIEADCNVELDDPAGGYPSAGTRNVSACIGDRVCSFSNIDTAELARKIEGVIYPNNYHVKIAITGCPNDCIKAHMQDIGIVGNVAPEYDATNCIACEACVKNCSKKITNALSIKNYEIDRDEDYCIQCGECILKCPTGAFSRGKTLYRIIVGGRTGKRNPRLANTFIENASEEVVLSICKNIYPFIDKHIDRSLPKEHVGYIIDRAGFSTFKDEVLNGVTLNDEAIIHEIVNPGYIYPRRVNL
ncbi:MAG: sulfite reductase subunit C [Leptospirales bacterium]